jgi:thiamine pyrophosphate-dependent acetolactate synthase large subunit-like protein
MIDRRDLCRAVLQERGDMIVIAGLGAPAWDITANGDCAENFPLWGGMGGAAMIGLGLALAQPKRKVLVITGDGEMLMGLGSLATIAVKRPPNLAILVEDNEHYGETGMQQTHTAYGVDLVAMAAGAGIPRTLSVIRADEMAGLRAAIHQPGCLFALAKINPQSHQLVLPPRDGAFLQNRLRTAVLGDFAHRQI